MVDQVFLQAVTAAFASKDDDNVNVIGYYLNGKYQVAVAFLLGFISHVNIQKAMRLCEQYNAFCYITDQISADFKSPLYIKFHD